MDRARWLDGHPMTVRVFDDGKCWVEYTGLVVCDKEDIDFCLRGLEHVDVGPGSIGAGFRECRNRILREDTRMSLDFEVSTIATMTVPDSWRLSLEAPRYSTIAPPVGVTRMSRSVSHPLLRSIHPSPSVLSTPQSVERYRRRSASKDSSNAVNKSNRLLTAGRSPRWRASSVSRRAVSTCGRATTSGAVGIRPRRNA